MEASIGALHLYELDGGDRTKVNAFKVKVEPGAVVVCVPGGDYLEEFTRLRGRAVAPC